MTERLIVIGGDAAGMSCASEARRRRPKDDLDIVVFERGDYTSYSACGIPYFIAGVVTDRDSLIARHPQEFRDKQDIDVRMRCEVTAIDTDARTVTTRSVDDGSETVEGFDQLMVATGGKPVKPEWPGVDARGIFGVQTLGDGFAVRAALEDGARSAVVVGSGYIGIEMAEAFKQRGLDVILVEKGVQPMSRLDPDMGAIIADSIRGEGIELLTNEGVEGFEERDGSVAAVVTERRTIEADIVVLGLGAGPNSDLATAAGIPIGPSRGIAVDGHMRTGIEGVWAAGDCAEKFHRISRKPVAISLGTHANKEGRIAGVNIGNGHETFPGVVGTAVSKVCKLEVARTGLGEQEAAAAGFEFVTAVVESTTRAGYFPGAAWIKTKMIAEKKTGRLVGAQIVGHEGAAKRIDVIATALWNEMTVQDMFNMDLSYAPPFSPVWDPVLITARKTWQKVENS
jgi:NADPH-dependent 2,4-dienoyl-CoA reductase/sulfur reductase-like enzyme